MTDDIGTASNAARPHRTSLAFHSANDDPGSAGPTLTVATTTAICAGDGVADGMAPKGDGEAVAEAVVLDTACSARALAACSARARRRKQPAVALDDAPRIGGSADAVGDAGDALGVPAACSTRRAGASGTQTTSCTRTELLTKGANMLLL